MKARVEAYRTNRGARIYRLPVELFPGFWGFAHLVLAGDLSILVDAGSGFGASNDHVSEGLAAVRQEYGEPIGWDSLTHVLVTHGHIDHFGGLTFVRSHASAPIAVHELDLRVLTNYEQRLMIVAGRLERFLLEVGVTADRREDLMSLYLLPEISPHQSPERLSHHTGLGHYLESLDRTLRWAGDVRLALGGHQGPIQDVPSRVEAIRRMHAERLARVLELLETPCTVAEVADLLFPGAGGYHALLALQEAGAHVEYLEQRGHLVIDNMEDLRRGGPIGIRYRRRAAAAPAPPLLLRSEAEMAGPETKQSTSV